MTKSHPSWSPILSPQSRSRHHPLYPWYPASDDPLISWMIHCFKNFIVQHLIIHHYGNISWLSYIKLTRVHSNLFDYKHVLQWSLWGSLHLLIDVNTTTIFLTLKESHQRALSHVTNEKWFSFLPSLFYQFIVITVNQSRPWSEHNPNDDGNIYCILYTMMKCLRCFSFSPPAVAWCLAK